MENKDNNNEEIYNNGKQSLNDNNITESNTENNELEPITENNEEPITENNNYEIKERKIIFDDVPIDERNNEDVMIKNSDDKNDSVNFKPSSSSSKFQQQQDLMESLPNQIINKEDTSNEESKSKNNNIEYNFCDMFEETEKNVGKNYTDEIDNNITLNHLNDINAINNLNKPNFNNFNNIGINKNTFLTNDNKKDNINLINDKKNIPLRYNRIVNIEDNGGSSNSLIRIFHKSGSIAENITNIENKEKFKNRFNKPKQNGLSNIKRHSTFISDAYYNKRHIKDLLEESELIKEDTNSVNEEDLSSIRNKKSNSSPNLSREDNLNNLNNINSNNENNNNVNNNDTVNEAKLRDFIKEKNLKKQEALLRRATFTKNPTFSNPNKPSFTRQPTNMNGNRPSFNRQQTKYQRKMKKKDSFSSSLDLLLYKSHEDMGYIDKIMLQKMNNTSKSRNVMMSREFERDDSTEEYEWRFYYPIEFTDNVESRKLYYEYKVRKSMTQEPLIIHRRNLLFIICLLLTLFLLALLLYDYHSLLIKEKNSKFFVWINAIYILHIVDISLGLLTYIYSNESGKKLFTIFSIILGLFTIVLFICRFIFNWSTKNLIPIDYK